MKKKFNRTRKHKALRRTVIAVLLLLAAVFISPFNFLPSQSLRLQEDDRLTGRTHIIRYMADRTPDADGITLATLSESENAVMWCLHRYSLITGWYPVCSTEADCSGAAPVCAAYCTFGGSGAEKGGAVFIGRITDDRIASVEVCLDPDAYGTAEQTVLARGGGFEKEDGQETFCIFAEDVYSFLIRPDGGAMQFLPLILCYGEDGSLICSAEFSQGWAAAL